MFVDSAAMSPGVKHTPSSGSRDDGWCVGWGLDGAFEERGRSTCGVDREVSAGARALDPAEGMSLDGNGPVGGAADAGMPAGVRLMQGQQSHAGNPTGLVGANPVWLLHLWVVVDVT